MPTLTILSHAVQHGSRLARIRNLSGKRLPAGNGRYGGDAAVLGSLVRGLTELGVDFNVNPNRFTKPAPTVLVQSGVPALARAIGWKREGRIQRLLAGPNLVIRSSDHGGILGDPAIDVCIVPSDWIRIAYEEDNDALAGRVRVWPAGVDASWWAPERTRAERAGQAVVYSKLLSGPLLVDVRRALERHGLESSVIEYGAYASGEFKAALGRAELAVFLSRTESQGIALAEAWAMDVPTLVWDPGEPAEILGRRYSTTSPAPYLSSATGATWHTVSELESLLDSRDFGAAPRDWVLENMTDLVAARELLEIAAK